MGPVGFPTRFEFPHGVAEGSSPGRRAGGAGSGGAGPGRAAYGRRCRGRCPPSGPARVSGLRRGLMGWHQLLQPHRGFVRSRFLLARLCRPPIGTRPAARGEPAAQPRSLPAPPITTARQWLPRISSAPLPAGKSPSPLLAHRLPQGRGGMAVVPVPIAPRRQRGQRNPKSSCPRCAQLRWGFVTRTPATASPHTPPPLPTTEPRVPLQPLPRLGQRLGPHWKKGGVRMEDHRCPASWLSPCTELGGSYFICPKQLKIASGFLGEYGEHGSLATGWMWSPAPRWCRLCGTAKLPAHAGPRSTAVPAGVGRIQPLERDGFGMTRSLPLSQQPESHRGCRVFPKLFRRLREPSPGHCAARAHVGSLQERFGDVDGSSLDPP